MFKYNLDEFIIFRGVLFCRGWCFHEGSAPVDIFVIQHGGEPQKINYTPQKSTDIQEQFGALYSNCRFDFHFDLNWSTRQPETSLQLMFSAGQDQMLLENPSSNVRSFGELQENQKLFFERVGAAQSGRVIEIGSRARSGFVRRDLFPPQIEYVGFDIMDGPNVDVVGDAHRLSDYFSPNYFDFVYTISTFEHLLMPWIAAVEMNKIMITGGYAYLQTHQAWPLHELPWDYYRFSKFSWQGIFNQYTGFKVVSTAHAQPCICVPCFYSGSSIYDIEYQEGYLLSSCVLQKVDETKVDWTANPREITDINYSH